MNKSENDKWVRAERKLLAELDGRPPRPPGRLYGVTEAGLAALGKSAPCAK